MSPVLLALQNTIETGVTTALLYTAVGLGTCTGGDNHPSLFKMQCFQGAL